MVLITHNTSEAGPGNNPFLNRDSHMPRSFVLVDCNSFFASCEKVFRPDLADKPVVVLSSNDGCVVARSKEAKAIGIPMGEPYFKIKHLLEGNRVAVFSSNFGLYSDMSRRVMRTLEQFAPEMEVYSVDEAFLDVTGVAIENLERFMTEIAVTVKKWTGIPVSVGMGPTKTLAKVANDVAKKSDSGTCHLFEADQRETILHAMDVGDVWGVGRRLVVPLKKLGIRTAWDLATRDPIWVRHNFSVIQEKMVRELCGEACYDLDNMPMARKSIQVSRSFGEPVTDLETLCEAVSSFAANAAVSLRKENSVASAVYVHVNTNRFHKEDYYSNGVTVPLALPSSSTPELIAAAVYGVKQIFAEEKQYKRAGVILMEIRDADAAKAQKTLFNLDDTKTDQQRETEQKLMKTLDRINRNMGRGTLFFAAEGIEQTWRPAANQKSRLFTTVKEDFPTAK